MSNENKTELKKEQDIARMIVMNMSFKTIMKRHNVSMSDIERIIERFNPGKRRVSTKLVGVCFGSRRTTYWENEMDVWTGKTLLDNPFKNLKYDDVKNEKIPEPTIEELKVKI